MRRRSRRWLVSSGAAVVGLGLLTGCGQLMGQAQLPPRVPRIGYLSPGRQGAPAPTIDAWQQGLRDLGWVDGENVMVEYRFADNKLDRYPEFAAELVSLPVDVLFTGAGTAAIRALQSATSTVPIVIVASIDVVEEGIVASFAAPGANLTGVSLASQISAKRMDLLKQALPRIARVAMLWYPGQQGQERATIAAARALGVEPLSLEVGDRDQVEPALETAVRWHADAILVSSGPVFSQQQTLLVELGAAKRLPIMYYSGEFVKAGGLMAYGPNSPGMFRQAAGHVHKILKGARPSDLPVEQPTRFDFLVNQATAQALGVALPPSVLQQATEIVQ